MLDPKAGIQEIKKVVRKEHGVKYSTSEIGDYLSEMDSNGEFLDIELDAVASRLCLPIKVQIRIVVAALNCR